MYISIINVLVTLTLSSEHRTLTPEKAAERVTRISQMEPFPIDRVEWSDRLEMSLVGSKYAKREIWTVDGEKFIAFLGYGNAGNYIFRINSKKTRILQAPHAFHDLNTGEIAAQMFFSGRYRREFQALFTNTAHRKHGKNRINELTKNESHPFQWTTCHHAREKDVIIQLHGFKKGKSDPHIILSGGKNEDAPVHVLKSKFQLSLLGTTSVYPNEIGRLVQLKTGKDNASINMEVFFYM